MFFISFQKFLSHENGIDKNEYQIRDQKVKFERSRIEIGKFYKQKSREKFKYNNSKKYKTQMLFEVSIGKFYDENNQ